MDNDSGSLNGYFITFTDKSEVKYPLYAIYITNPVDKDVNTTVLYELV